MTFLKGGHPGSMHLVFKKAGTRAVCTLYFNRWAGCTLGGQGAHCILIGGQGALCILAGGQGEICILISGQGAHCIFVCGQGALCIVIGGQGALCILIGCSPIAMRAMLILGGQGKHMYILQKLL